MRPGVCSGLMELCLDFTEEVLVGILVVQSLGLGSELPQGVPADGMHGWRVEPSWVLWLLGLHHLWLTWAHILCFVLVQGNRNSTGLKVQGLHPDFTAGKRNPSRGSIICWCRRNSSLVLTVQVLHSPLSCILIPSFLLWDQEKSGLWPCLVGAQSWSCSSQGETGTRRARCCSGT